MGKIVLLPEVLRNQIAAGEVVERPASVVKELVENAVDAGAREIRVEIAGGGRRKISVEDNGDGMGLEDLRLAVHRHATSKIRTLDELHGVVTLGFRGEALAAIVSVARVRIASTERNAPEGRVMLVHGGEEISIEPSAPVPGTQVLVEDLFFNTPARRKFLKTDTTEGWHCIEAVTQRALVDLDRAYVFLSEGKTVVSAPRAASRAERLAALYGSELVDGLVPVDAEWAGIRVSGFVSTRDFRSSRRQQHVFVNGRPVRSYEVQQSLYHALGGILPAGRHPVFFLYVDLPPELVDVNVHPTKREVRFADPGTIKAAVGKAVRPAVFGFGGTGVDFNTRSAAPTIDGEETPAIAPASTRWESWNAHRPPEASGGGADRAGSGVADMFTVRDDHLDYHADAPLDMVPVGSAFLAISEDGGLTLVDYHAAHERILYERFLGRGLRTERLLVPRKVSLDRAECGILLELSPVLRDLGIELEDFGGQTLLVREIPEELSGSDLQAVLRDMVDAVRDKDRPDAADLRHVMAARLACRDAVKAGDRMRHPQVRRLIADLEATEHPETCPHGRPTRIHLSEAELRRLFKRT